MQRRNLSWIPVAIAVVLCGSLAACPSQTQTPADMPDDPAASKPAMLTEDGEEGAEGPERDGPEAIPHEVKGREACTSCHQVGTGEGKMPSDHTGRGDDACLGCHKAAM